MIVCYTLKSVPCPVIIRDTSSGSWWNLVQRLIDIHYEKRDSKLEDFYYCRRLLVHFPATQTPKIITQKLYYLNHYLVDHLSILLAGSYIQYFVFYLEAQAYLQDSNVSISNGISMSSPWLCLLPPSIQFSFPPCLFSFVLAQDSFYINQ